MTDFTAGCPVVFSSRVGNDKPRWIVKRNSADYICRTESGSYILYSLYEFGLVTFSASFTSGKPLPLSVFLNAILISREPIECSAMLRIGEKQ